MRERVKKVLIIGAAVLLGGCAYALFREITGIGIPCFFHLITGLNCPGCGVTRMLLSALKLDFASAFRYNAVLFCLMPFLLFLLSYWVYRFIRYGTKASNKMLEISCWISVGILIAWGVVRNLIGM